VDNWDNAGPDLPEGRFEVGIIVARRRLKGPWASHAWLPLAALPAAPAAAPWTRLSEEEDGETFFAGAYELSLHPAETSHYRDNLLMEQPSLWILLREDGDGCSVAAVTADPYEGEAMAEGNGEVVEAVPMPRELQVKVLAFVEAFHIERRFEKRKRDRADPEALARGAQTRRGGGEK
jgi:hypothetical protein